MLYFLDVIMSEAKYYQQVQWEKQGEAEDSHNDLLKSSGESSPSEEVATAARNQL